MRQPYFIDLNNGYWIAFFTDTCRFFKTNLNGKTLIEDISSGADFNRVSTRFSITQEQYFNYVKAIESYSILEPNYHVSKCNCSENPEKKKLDRLVIHVANDCNLRCIYCYASGGGYGSTRKLISPEMLETTLSRFFFLL